VERCAFFTDWRSFTARLAYRPPGSGSFRVPPSASERTQGIQCVFQRFLFLGGATSVKENFSATRFHGFFSLRDSRAVERFGQLPEWRPDRKFSNYDSGMGEVPWS
jgi:hypothetical protein